MSSESGSISFRILIAPNNLKRASRWGDYFFARSLKKGFEAEGVAARIVARDGWYKDLRDNEFDVYLRGFGGFEPIDGRTSLIWVISHPGNIQIEELTKYDHVFVATRNRRPLARALGRFKVHSMLQATDPEIMRPDADAVTSDLLFVGINRRGGRPTLAHAKACGMDIDLYGSGWADHPEYGHWLKSDLIPNEELGRYYAGATAVLNDHWRDMRRSGYISNRVFDVLACGRPLISDTVSGLPEEFQPFIYTWTDTESFREVVEAARNESDHRRAERLALSETVRREHSFQARAREFIRKVHEIIG